jgi:SAM-dependent methyltransferase
MATAIVQPQEPPMTEADPRIAFFDAHAPNWDTDGPPITETIARLTVIRQRLGLDPGRDVAEIGCGTGQVTGWLADAVRPGRVTAVDFAPGMLTRARRRGVQADFLALDVCAQPLPRAAYDIVLCLNVFPHFRDPGAALANFAAALRPTGRLVILHLASWRDINAFHAGVDGIVSTDLLPEPTAWPALLATANLHMLEIDDAPDLFLVTAQPQ